MKKFAFIILNYLTPTETVKCVESIEKNCKECQYKIYIVDNCSPDSSGEYLKKKYENCDSIEIFLCDKNLGFAKGNNVGFKKAKYEYNADFIILCNSDTIILNDDFCQTIVKKYEIDKYAVLGPKEILPNGKNYPLNDEFPTVESTKRKIKILKKKLLANENIFFSIYYNALNLAKKIIKKIIRKKQTNNTNKLDVNTEYKNIILHGFFLVFSNEYIKRFDGLDERTFFYGEEDLLAIRLKREGLLSIYYPEIEILHNKNSATNAKTKNKREKNIFVYKNQIQSLNIVIDVLNSE